MVNESSPNILIPFAFPVDTSVGVLDETLPIVVLFQVLVIDVTLLELESELVLGFFVLRQIQQERGHHLALEDGTVSG